MTAVGDVQIPSGIQCCADKQRVGPSEIGASGRAAIPDRSASHQRSGAPDGIDCSGGAHLANCVVAFVGKVEIAGAIDDDALGVR